MNEYDQNKSDIFALGLDDFTFPVTYVGMRKAGCITESATDRPNSDLQIGILENAAIFANDASIRADAMSAVLGWLEAGEYGYADLDNALTEIAGLNDTELDEEDEDYYSELWGVTIDALATLGADTDDLQTFYDGPGEKADQAGNRIGAYLSKKLDEVEEDDDDIILAFSMAGDEKVMESAKCDSDGIFEGVYKWMKRVVDGSVKRVHKRIAGKGQHLSAASKAALKKARKFASRGTAKMKRMKSLKIGRKRGLYD